MDYVATVVMQKNVKTVPPDMAVAELEASFVREQVSGFAVVDNGRLVGVVSRSDIMRALSPPDAKISRIVFAEEFDSETSEAIYPRLADTLGDRAKAMHVKDIMTVDVVTVGPNECIRKVADLMYENRIHRIFVVRDDQLLGVITPFDFVRMYSEERIGADTRPKNTEEF